VRPRPKPQSWSALAYACLIAQATQPVKAGEPSTRQLIDLAPIVRSSDQGCRTIKLCGYVRANESTCLTFRAIYRAPDHVAILIRDGADETPLFLAADRKMLLYDPLRSALLWKQDTDVHFSLAKEESGLRIHLDVTTDRNMPSNASVDVKSLVAGSFMSDKVVWIGDRKYRLTRTTEKGDALECAIDLDQQQPYTNIKIIHDGQKEPSLCISQLEITGDVDREQLFFPKMDDLAEKTCLADLPGGAMEGSGGGLTFLMKACYARAAINRPEMREPIERAGFSDIDWTGIEANDKKLAQVLRQALKTAGPRR
jgi:hypothetical protein